MIMLYASLTIAWSSCYRYIIIIIMADQIPYCAKPAAWSRYTYRVGLSNMASDSNHAGLNEIERCSMNLYDIIVDFT